MIEYKLKKRWEDFAGGLGATKEIDTAWEWICSAYSESHRYYHNLTHIKDCLDTYDSVQRYCFDDLSRYIVEFAIWFHDSIYNTQCNDNERKSGALARNAFMMMNVPHQFIDGIEYSREDIIDEIENYINYTCHTSHDQSDKLHADLSLFLDIDLSILGKPKEFFDLYERNIRKEYEWVPLDIYRAKRIEILTNFKRRPSIYQHKHMQLQYEKAARNNIDRAIGSLC